MSITQADLDKLAHDVDGLVNVDTPKANFFMLIVYPGGVRTGRAHYVTNAPNKDLIAMLRGQLKVLEGLGRESGPADA